MAEEKLIGKITHYFGKISVAAMRVEASLKVGDVIHLIGHGADFTQTLSSMQIDGQNIETANAGDEIGFKVDSPVKEGVEVYLVTE
ncbi:MAG TPA: hypothetical protein PKZ16_02195 [bacterium]|nr:hypothetical protein [bacterium]HPL95559.1 hypothetical protein [bacterium]